MPTPDGDQMAVHLPLSNEAVLEAQILMLQSHNIPNPANGVHHGSLRIWCLVFTISPRCPAQGEGLMTYGLEEAINTQ